MADAGEGAQFFSPWEGPPPFVQAPEDAGLRQRITKLAEFAKRNGPNFVDLIINKQQDNPEYGFLFGGEGSDYYRWGWVCSERCALSLGAEARSTPGKLLRMAVACFHQDPTSSDVCRS